MKCGLCYNYRIKLHPDFFAGSVRSDVVKKRLQLLCTAYVLLLISVPVSAAGVGDVYAALRDIGVPEEYVSQAAGVLARGTSDGAGVYRSDGSYYAYSDMVGYIYANKDTILAYCGVLSGETAPAETTAVTVDSAQGSGTDFAAETAQITTTAQTTTVTTTTLMTTSAVTTSGSLPETTAAVYSEDAEPKKSWLPAAALGLIAAGCGGLLGLIRLIRKQDSESD